VLDRRFHGSILQSAVVSGTRSGWLYFCPWQQQKFFGRVWRAVFQSPIGTADRPLSGARTDLRKERN